MRAPRCRPGRGCCGTRWPRRGRRRYPPSRTTTRCCGRCTTRRCWITWPGYGNSGSRPGFRTKYGRDRVVPYVFPTPGMLAGLPVRTPPAVHGRAGLFCYDTMTLVGPGSWAAIRGAADAALTAADLVSSGERLAYALCRPPGHHATRSAYGGSCYLNNAAIAAQALIAAGAGRVAVLDIDAHHGNGTQSIFYDRGDVCYGSVHVDPGAGWFPHYVGLRRRARGRPGRGRQPEPAAAARHRRRGLARSGAGHVRGRGRARPRRRGGLARRGRRRDRPGEPAAGDRGRLPRRRAG